MPAGVRILSTRGESLTLDTRFPGSQSTLSGHLARRIARSKHACGVSPNASTRAKQGRAGLAGLFACFALPFAYSKRVAFLYIPCRRRRNSPNARRSGPSSASEAGSGTGTERSSTPLRNDRPPVLKVMTSDAASAVNIPIPNWPSPPTTLLRLEFSTKALPEVRVSCWFGNPFELLLQSSTS